MKPRPDNKRGVALLTTLLVLVLVIVLTNEIFRLGTRTAQTSAYGKNSVSSTMLAEAGISAVRVVLRIDAKDNSYDTLNELWAQPTPPFEMGNGTISIYVEDEERKINLNKLVMPNGNAPDEDRVAMFRAFLTTMGIDATIADAFVDWLDNDDTPRVGGAESNYYLSLPRPYKAKNDLFDTIEEILLVRGVTPEIYDKIQPFVTVTSSGKININTAPVEILMSLSAGRIATESGAIDRESAMRLIEYRRERSFQKVSDIGNVSPLFKNLYNQQSAFFLGLLDIKSTHFHIRSSGNVADTIRTIDAIGARTGNDIKWVFRRLE